MLPSLHFPRRPTPTPEEASASRARTLEIMRKCREAQSELERVCREKGIEIPVMVCRSNFRVSKAP